MSDSKNFFTSKGPTRFGRGGPRTIQLSEYVKYEIPDYGYPDEDEPDPTKYPKGPSGRPIAGSKRVARYREQGSPLTSGNMLQSITANPALAYNSFEEMRTECYRQSMVATGTRPMPVDPAKAPWSVIPPVFHAFRDDATDEGPHAEDVAINDGGLPEGS